MASKNNVRKLSFQQATCAAILAASFAAPLSADTSHAVQGTTAASILASGCVALKAAALESIQRYCVSSWRQAGIPQFDWDDCTQDAILELLSRLPASRANLAIEDPESPERRELMRSIWCVTQRWRRNHVKSHLSLEHLDYSADPDSNEHDFDLELLEQAISELSPTQQQILSRTRHGDTVAEIADELNIPPARISDQKYKAVRKLQRSMAV